MKKVLALLLCVLLLAGCAPKWVQFSVTWTDLFDTVTTVSGFASNREAFNELAEAVYEQLKQYHQLFDIYREYEGINNLKTVNDAAGKAPVKVDGAITQLLSDCVDYHALTEGRVNVAMGSVLSLWHHARETKTLPSDEALREAAQHTDISKLIIDRENSTVFLADPDMRLDVGAIAKGWAAQKVAESMYGGWLLSVGGNVCATGAKRGDQPWVVGVQNPDGGSFLHTIPLSTGSVVTSGDYQRFAEIDGKKYHHIIDPDTLQPAAYWRAVTVVCGDSALADALSTALFVLPLNEGKVLLAKTDAEAMWLDADGTKYYSDGFEYLS
ncbi:MAG: FAD:protein FMN transferase [Ruminococcaceae bacterium]|nr:FAD:protein FMN transferase [Oscillospiraceae bacterium]